MRPFLCPGRSTMSPSTCPLSSHKFCTSPSFQFCRRISVIRNVSICTKTVHLHRGINVMGSNACSSLSKIRGISGTKTLQHPSDLQFGTKQKIKNSSKSPLTLVFSQFFNISRLRQLKAKYHTQNYNNFRHDRFDCICIDYVCSPKYLYVT